MGALSCTQALSAAWNAGNAPINFLNMTDPIELETIRPAELYAGKVWRTVTATWKSGTRHNQQLDIGDNNWCAGAAMANLWEGATGEIESGKLIYEQARKQFDFVYRDHPDSDFGGARLQDCAQVLIERHAQDSPLAQVVKLADFDQIMAWLVAVGPVAFGCRWPSGMFSPRTHKCKSWMEYKGNGSLKHAACVIGTSAKGFVRIENSYGMTWGSKGLAWMRHEDFRRAMEQDRAVAYGIRLGSITIH